MFDNKWDDYIIFNKFVNRISKFQRVPIKLIKDKFNINMKGTVKQNWIPLHKAFLTFHWNLQNYKVDIEILTVKNSIEI